MKLRRDRIRVWFSRCEGAPGDDDDAPGEAWVGASRLEKEESVEWVYGVKEVSPRVSCAVSTTKG